MKGLESHYDCLAEKYASIHPLRLSLVDFIERRIFAEKSLKPFGQVVDFGCGSGELLENLSKRVPFPDLLCGVDISTSMVQAAKRKGMHVIHANFENVFFERGSVFLGVFQESIHHADLDLLGANLDRIMCPDGKLIVFYQSDWFIEPNLEALDTLLDVARMNRRGPENIITALNKCHWNLIEDELVEDRCPVDLEFIENALLLNALSYWVSFSDRDKKTRLAQITESHENTPLFLNRKIRALVFSRH
jgi:SAM-dependent methyltransferase